MKRLLELRQWWKDKPPFEKLKSILKNFWIPLLINIVAGLVLWIIQNISGKVDNKPKDRTDASLRDKQEKSYISFGFVQLRWETASNDTARLTIFVNAAPSFDRVRVSVNGTDYSKDIDRDDTSPKSIELPLPVQPDSVIVTCLVVPDTYASDKSRFATVIQRFTPPAAKADGEVFPKKAPPQVNSNLDSSAVSCSPDQKS